MSQQSRNTAILEPNWSDWRQRRNAGIPPAMLLWLRDTGSLTRRVIQACDKGTFRVRLLHQGWGTPLYSERRILNMRRGVVAMVRDVELLCNEHPWVFARTLIPITSLRGSARRLMQLGEKPLGAVLFSDPKVSRGSTQIAQLLPGHPLFSTACNHLNETPASLWGRRTLFYVANGRPLLVNEIFLPGLPMEAGGC